MGGELIIGMLSLVNLFDSVKDSGQLGTFGQPSIRQFAAVLLALLWCRLLPALFGE